jgi:peptide/nickel transport system substrate-binding protein
VSHHHTRRLLAALLVVTALASGCGGGKAAAPASDEDATPVRGGSLTYGLEAETGDGWCLPEAQLAISGIMVARSIYDTLTAPNSEGEYVPHLAEAVEPNAEFTEWTITLREGVTFHDGSPLTAEVVKDNLDAYRGQYPGRSSLLFVFILDAIDTVEVTGDLEVTVTTDVPWVAFPAFLYSSGRLGIVGQAQLDDAETCDRALVGTGPFRLESWQRDQELVAVRNPDYWQEAPDGEPYPYLDEIRFQPIVESGQRVNALEAGDIQVMHTSTPDEFVALEALAADGVVDLRDSQDFAEVAFVQINASHPPLDDVRIRRAMAMAIDRDDYQQVITRGQFTMASGPFWAGAIG